MLQDLDFQAALRKIEILLKPYYRSGISGMHPLQRFGQSLEFAGYREYRPGDELRDLDWKVFARSDRHYIKQRDAHVPGKALVLLDDSASMAFASDEGLLPKWDLALFLCFSLVSVLQRQGDSFALQTFSNSETIRLGSSRRHLSHLLQQLQQLHELGPAAPQSDLPPSLPEVDRLFVISDFFAPAELWSEWFARIRRQSRHTQPIRILDPEEISPNPTKGLLQNIEATKEYRHVTQADWSAYKNNFQQHAEQLQQIWKDQTMLQVSTATPFPQTLAHLAKSLD